MNVIALFFFSIVLLNSLFVGRPGEIEGENRGTIVEEGQGSILHTGLCIASNCTKERATNSAWESRVGQNVAEWLSVVGRTVTPPSPRFS